MRVLIMACLFFFSFSLHCDQKADQNLSLMEALEQFYTQNKEPEVSQKKDLEKEPIENLESSLYQVLEGLQNDKNSEEEIAN